MFAYLILFCLILLLLRDKRALPFVFAYCIFLAMFRGYEVGTDVAGYTYNYSKMTWNPNTWNAQANFGYLYNVFIMTIKDIMGNPMFAWGVSSSVYTWGYYRFVKKYAICPQIAFFFFVGIGSYFLGYNIMRQCFALGLVLLFLSYHDCLNLKLTYDKKDNKDNNGLTLRGVLLFAICVFIIAWGIHSVSVILLLLILFASPKAYKYVNYKVLILLLVGTFALGTSSYVTNLILNLSGIESLGGAAMSYALRNIQLGEDSGYSLVKLTLNTLFGIYVVFINRKHETNLFSLSYVFGICFLNLFGLIVVEFARISEIFLALGTVFLAEVYMNGRRITKIALVLYVFALYFNTIVKNIGEIVPYTFEKNIFSF